MDTTKAAAIPPPRPDGEEVSTALIEAIKAGLAGDETKRGFDDLFRKYAGRGTTPTAIQIRDEMTDYVLHCMLGFIGLLDRHVKELEAEVKQLEARPGFKYWGVWSGARECSPGDFVTHSGSLWHANATTRSRPGTGPEWTLVCKRGSDGKDGRDAPGAA